MGKYDRYRHATDDNMADAHCMLGIYDYKHTLRKCNISYFSIATPVTLKFLSGTLQVYCLALLNLCATHLDNQIVMYLNLLKMLSGAATCREVHFVIIQFKYL